MKTITYEKHPKRLPRSVFMLALVKSCVTVFSPGAILFWGSRMPFPRPWWMRPWWRHRPQQQEATSEQTSLDVDRQRVLPSVESGAHMRSQRELQAEDRSIYYIADLTERFGLIRVGYLELGFPYTKGATSKTFFDHLVTLVAYSLHGRSLGYHTCDLGRCGRGSGLSRLSRTF